MPRPCGVRWGLFAGTVTLVATLAFPGYSSATVYCVNAPPCASGISEPAVQPALNAAQSHPGSDTVRIGAGTYSRPNGFSYSGSPSNSLTMVGAGQGSTTLTMPGDPTLEESVLSLAGNATTMQMTVRLPSEPNNSLHQDTGLWLDNSSAQHVAISAPSSANHTIGIQGFGISSFIDGAITLPYASVANVGVESFGSTTTRRATIKADDGVIGGDAIVDRTTLMPGPGGVGVHAGDVTVRNSLIKMAGPQGATGLDVSNQTATSPLQLDADHVTIIGGHSDAIGLRVAAIAPIDNGGQTASATLTNSVITGGQTSILRQAQNNAPTNPQTSTASVTTSYSNFRLASAVSSNGIHGTGKISATDFVSGTPTFVGGGDLHPAPGSILVDSGDPTFSGGFDLLDEPRVVDGDGNGSAITDLGALERQK